MFYINLFNNATYTCRYYLVHISLVLRSINLRTAGRKLSSLNDNSQQHQRQRRIRSLRRRGPAPSALVFANPMESFGGISIGDRFRKLTVVRRAENQGQHACWECVCDCKPGQTIVVRGDRLRAGNTVSCGCAQRQYQETRTENAEKALQLKNFGRVFVMGTVREFQGRRQVHAVCVCRYCSGTSVQRASDVLRKNFRGCDCVFKEPLSYRVWKYGFPPPSGPIAQREPIQVTMMRANWRNMVSRCHNQNNRDYPNWGGRGIFVCERWRTNFEAFLEDNGVRPLELTLDRIDNHGPYSPDNCKWSTRGEQNENRRNTIFVEYEGKRITLAKLAKHLGISYAQAYRRHRAGRTSEQIALWAKTKREAPLAAKA